MLRSALLTAALTLTACGPIQDPTDPDTDVDAPETYDFHSASSGLYTVAYSGQTMRNLLIADLRTHLGGLTDRIDGGWFPEDGEVVAELDFFLDFDGASSGSVAPLITTDPEPEQATYGEISTSADLTGKIAGNDPVGQHVDWSTAMVGWEEEGVTTPESLVRHWFDQVDAAAVARANGTIPLGPDGGPIPSVTITEQGVHVEQLVQKFLLGAIAYSQAADDYMDDDEPGKGLLADNTAPDEGAAYTALEHAWDEGFGYFGASRDYGQYTPAEIVADLHRDTNEDGAIDLSSEMNWAMASYAAQRDLGSAAGAPTDWSGDLWEAFLSGRALISSTDNEALTEAEATELAAWRDQALESWEGVIAANVVHYVNATLQDMATAGTDAYSFASHAAHWSEAKAFALAFQFNPRSTLSTDEFAELHTLLGQAPVLPSAPATDQDAFADDLRAARDLLGGAFGFAAANLGDDDGLNGW